MKVTAGRDGTALEDLSACNAPPQSILSELSVEQIDAVDNPQIIRRVKGAKYIVDFYGVNMPPYALETIMEKLKAWWDTDEAFLVIRHPIRIGVMILPEVSD